MSRDVELVIRAKDAATQAIDSIKDALKDLTGVQDDVGKSAAKTDNLLSDLGTQLSKLNKEAQGLAALGKVAGELDKASGAVTRLESGVRTSAAEFAKLARETEAAVQNANRLRGQLESEKNVLRQNTDAHKAARKELTEANRELTRAEANQERYNKALAAQPKPQRAIRSAGVFIEADVSNARAKQAQLTQDVANYKANIDRAKAAIETLTPQVAAATSQQNSLSNATEKSSNALSRNRDDLNKARTVLQGMNDAANQASVSFNGLALNQDKVAQSSARMAAELAATKARIESINKGQTTVKLTPNANAETASLQTQRRALLEARREWVNAEAEVKRLAQAMQATTAPTEQMGRALGQAQAAARLAKVEYQGQQQALQRLSSSAQSSFAAFSQAASGMRVAGTTATTATQGLAGSAQQAATAIAPIAPATRAAGSALGSAASGGNSFRDALTGIYGESRKALSFAQRLRGEVLSLTAGFLGFQAAISNIGGVVKAFQTLEAAQSRLGVVFSQDTSRTRQELEWLQRQASRLGISFGVLSDEYGKFAVAAQAANFSSDNTRKIFLSVAEAGRVNKLSLDQMSGVFLALQQMISKGKVSSEELRRQLGDRLAGAFNIFADALGMTTAELDEAMKKGEVFATQTNMLKFADELTKRFGPQLGTALKSTSAEIGRWQNNVLQAQLAVAQGGFIDAFTNALRSMNAFFESREGADFFLSLGASLGRLIDVLANVPKYFTEIKTVISAVIALKLAGVLTGIIAALRNTATAAGLAQGSFFSWSSAMAALRGQLATVSAGFNTFSTAVTNFTGRTTAAVASMSLLRMGLVGLQGVAGLAAGAFRLLWAAVGGLPGLVLTGITLALGAWVTRIDEATSALDEHKRQMQAVISRYEEAKGKVDDWSKGVKGVTVSQAEDNLSKLLQAYAQQFDDINDKASRARKSLESIRNGTRFSKAPVDPVQLADIERLIKSLDDLGNRTITVQQFREELDRIAQSTSNGGLKDLAVELQNAVDEVKEGQGSFNELTDAITKTEARIRLLKGQATDADKALLGLKEAADASGNGLSDAGDKAKIFGDNLTEIRKLIPGIANELKRLEDIAALDKLYKDAANAARTMSELTELTRQYNAAQDGINVKSFGGTGMEASINLIKKREGFRSDPYKDNDGRYRVGYGSDTVTLADGSIQKVVQGISISEADAMRDLVRRIGEFQDVVKGQIGSGRFNAFSPDQQAVLTSMAYNYGRLPGDIVEAIKTGSAQQIATAIRGRAGDNGGINRDRRNEEASLFEQGGDTVKSQQEVREVEEKRAEKAKEYNTELQNRLSLQEQENSNNGKLTRDAFIQKQLAEEQNRARAAEVTLLPDQIEKIKQLAGAEWDIKNAKTGAKADQEAANVALQQAVALSQQRATLERAFRDAQKIGDQDKALSLQEQMVGVNTQLQEAIDKARAMWQAIGGPEADVALTKLDTLKIKTDTATSGLNFFGLSTQQVNSLAVSFADGFVGALDSFAQAVANGENAIQALGRAFLQFAADFLRQIATMILKQMVLNALQAITGSAFGTAHTGGIVGSVATGMGNNRRNVSPAVFAGAMRYHSGGVAGLRPNEVPTILKKGEEVLTENDPRHRNNGGMNPAGGGGSAPMALRNIVVLDEESAANWMGSSSGEQVVLSMLKKNRATLKKLVGA